MNASILRKLLLAMLSICVSVTIATPLNRIEYAIDPPSINGYWLTGITLNGDSAAGSFTVPIGGLSDGFHTVLIRTVDNNNRKSIPVIKSIWVQRSLSTVVPYGEYFFDVDPGPLHGNEIIFLESDSVSVSFEVPITTLTRGFHVLGIRVNDRKGNWSHPTLRPLWVEYLPSTMVSAAEWFLDEDPGRGAAHAVTIIPADSVNSQFIASLTGISSGFHALGFRVKATNGIWSAPIFRPIWVQQLSGSQISAAEWFLDTDPGRGVAHSVIVTPSDSVNSRFIAPLTGISNGMHSFGFRVKAANGVWSYPINHSFWCEQVSSRNIVAAEYSIDGLVNPGSGTSVGVSVADSVNTSFNIPLSTFSNGFHSIWFRTRDAAGKWSMPISRYFWKGNSTTVRPHLTRAEYFLDTDPGIGNANTVSIANADSVHSNFLISLSSIALGNHSLFIRTRDENGVWSTPAFSGFIVAQPPGSPSLLSVQFLNPGAQLSWTPSSSSVTGYRIYRYSSGYFTPPGTGNLIGTVSGSTTTFIDTGVTGVNYYRVTAIN